MGSLDQPLAGAGPVRALQDIRACIAVGGTCGSPTVEGKDYCPLHYSTRNDPAGFATSEFKCDSSGCSLPCAQGRRYCETHLQTEFVRGSEPTPEPGTYEALVKDSQEQVSHLVQLATHEIERLCADEIRREIQEEADKPFVRIHHKAKAKVLAEQHWHKLTEMDYDDGKGFNFRREYPSCADYVDEWWEERHLPIVRGETAGVPFTTQRPPGKDPLAKSAEDFYDACMQVQAHLPPAEEPPLAVSVQRRLQALEGRMEACQSAGNSKYRRLNTLTGRILKLERNYASAQVRKIGEMQAEIEDKDEQIGHLHDRLAEAERLVAKLTKKRKKEKKRGLG